MILSFIKIRVSTRVFFKFFIIGNCEENCLSKYLILLVYLSRAIAGNTHFIISINSTDCGGRTAWNREGTATAPISTGTSGTSGTRVSPPTHQVSRKAYVLPPTKSVVKLTQLPIVN